MPQDRTRIKIWVPREVGSLIKEVEASSWMGWAPGIISTEHAPAATQTPSSLFRAGLPTALAWIPRRAPICLLELCQGIHNGGHNGTSLG